MALNQFMHTRNRYKDNKPDFNKLAEKYPHFAKHVSVNLAGNASLDFHDAEALRSLTCTLLKEDFDLDVELPLDRLIPTVPLRLNYIHWIEDLMQQNGCSGDVYGIDIGCGASCIYPLLGCQMNGWHFTASEKDDLGYQYACDNVKRNDLQDLIKVVPSPKDTIIEGVFKSAPQSTYHFTMCNPPFFGNILEAQGIMSRTMDRPDPKSVSTASEVEMIYEDGGEVDFVKRMIVESLQLREQVVWYTSMLGKKSSVAILKGELQKHKIRNFTTTEFCQGRTMRWGIAWTFCDDIKVLPPSKRRKTKQRPPLIIPVPDRFVTTSVASSSSSSVGKREKVMAVAETTKKMLTDLQISFAIQSSSRKVVNLECTAYTNTWANQRRKRRQRQRQKTKIKKQDVVLPETNIEDTGIVTTTCAKTNPNVTCASKPELQAKITTTSKETGLNSSTEITAASVSTNTNTKLDVGLASHHANSEFQTQITTDSEKTTSESGVGMQPDSNGRSCIIDSEKCDTISNTNRTNHDLKTTDISNADQKYKLDANMNGNMKCDSQHDISDATKGVVEPKVSVLQDSSVKGPQIDLKVTANENKNVEPKVLVLQDLSVKEPSAKSPKKINKDESLFEGKDNNEPKSTAREDTNQKHESCLKSHAGPIEKAQDIGNVDISINDTRVKSQNCAKSQTDSKEGAQCIDRNVDPLFKCSLVVKIDDDKMTIEMGFVDGCSKEAMHQVGQYIKNQFAKGNFTSATL